MTSRASRGFVLPGDRVDVVLTRQQDKNLAATDVVLQNVRVLAVDQVADERTDKPSLAKAITLEVEVTAAQKLALAATVGTLSLVLRKAGEAAADQHAPHHARRPADSPRWRPTIAFPPSRSCAVGRSSNTRCRQKTRTTMRLASAKARSR